MTPHFVRQSALAILLVAASRLGAESQAPLLVAVAAEPTVATPVNRGIYGHFIELGFGRQAEGMWAEMLFNRSLEEVPAYRPNHWNWLRRGPADDLSKETWWHSGYEETPWTVHPVSPKVELRKVDHGIFRHGEWGAVLANGDDTAEAALVQERIHLKRGETYQFKAWLRTHQEMWDLGPTPGVTGYAEVRLYKAGEIGGEPIAKARFDNLQSVFTKVTAELANPDYEGWAVFTLWTGPKSHLNMDDLSLMPASNWKGWRREAVEASKRIKPPIIRYPGGCFASFYQWREGIGPREERMPRVSAFWGGLNDNDIGTPEFMELCREIGSEPFLCINMMTATPADAAEWVAYCNAPATHPIGALRARDGHTEPFNVHYWELDNETYRKYGPWEYAEKSVEWSRAMKAVDPSIKTVLVVYANYLPYLKDMLAIAGKDVDLITDRNTDEGLLRNNLAILKEYNAANGTNIQLCNTEWLPYMFDVPVQVDEFNRQPVPADDTFQNRQIRWQYAMNAGRQLITFQRLGGDFVFANFNNFGNTWGQNVIEFSKESVFLSPTGLVFELMADSPAAWPVETTPAFPAEKLEVRAALDADKKRAVVYTLNYSEKARPVRVNLSAIQAPLTTGRVRSLVAESLTSRFTVTDQSSVTRRDTTVMLTAGKEFDLMVEPFSFTHIVVE